MTLALSIASHEELKKLTSYTRVSEESKEQTNYPTLNFKLVDTEVYADTSEEQKLKQIKPFVVFYAFNEDTAKLRILQRVKETETSASTIGFYDIITEENFNGFNVVKDEQGVDTLSLNLATLLQVAKTVGLASVEKDLGSFEALDKVKATANFEISLFGEAEDNPDAIYVIFPVKLEDELFDQLESGNVMKQANAESIGVCGLNMDAIIETMDTSPVTRKVIGEIYEKSGIDEISMLVLNYVIRKEASELLRDIDYTNLLAMAKQLRAEREAKAIDAEAKSVSDVEFKDVE